MRSHASSPIIPHKPTNIQPSAMRKWLITFAMTLPSLLGACSGENTGSKNSYTRYGEHTRKSKESLDDLERLPGNSRACTKAEALAKYLPGKKARDIKAADYLEANERALAKLDFDAATIFCTEAIKLAPSDPVAYYKRGRASLYSTNAEESQAQADLERAIALNCRDSKAYEFLARIYDSHSHKDKAIAAMTKAVELNPVDTGLYQQRAALYAAYGNKGNAMKDYDKWLEIAPTMPQPYVLRGQLLESMQKYDLAIRDYEKAYTLPEVSDSISNRDMALKLKVNLLSKLNRHKESIFALDKAIKQNKHDDDLLRLRGDEYMFLKEYQKAIADYTESIDNAPEFARKTLEARGRAYTAVGDKERADKDFNQSKRLFEKPAEKPI